MGTEELDSLHVFKDFQDFYDRCQDEIWIREVHVKFAGITEIKDSSGPAEDKEVMA